MRLFLQEIKAEVLQPLISVEEIIASANLPADEKIKRIESTLLNFPASRPAVENQMSKMLAETDPTSAAQEFYDILEQKSLTLQKRTADIIRLLRVDEKSVNQDLFKALEHFQAKDGHIEKNAPREFLSEKEQNAINFNDKKFPVSLYKILLFQKIAGGIKSGKVNFTASHKYRSLEDYLIPLVEWENNKANLLEKAELARWLDFSAHESELLKITHQTFTGVNQKLNDNQWFKQGSGDHWTISTPAIDKSEFSGLKQYFPTRQLMRARRSFYYRQSGDGFS